MVCGSATARSVVALRLGQAPACSAVSERQLHSPGMSPSLLPQTRSQKTTQVTSLGQVELCGVEEDE